jgi:hypothetical protein
VVVGCLIQDDPKHADDENRSPEIIEKLIRPADLCCSWVHTDVTPYVSMIPWGLALQSLGRENGSQVPM